MAAGYVGPQARRAEHSYWRERRGPRRPLDRYEQVYDKLLAEAKAANPKIKLVLCEPFLKPVGKVSEGIRRRQEIVARLAKKYGPPW